MTENCKAAVLASLAGDALALGVHWDYDPKHIEQTHGRVNTYLEPQPGSFHSGKKAGDFTHYGDQTTLLLSNLAKGGAFDPQSFAQDWRDMFRDYSGYMDMASKQTIAKMDNGGDLIASGSSSDELAGASRISPLFCLLGHNPRELIQAAKAQTAITHNNPAVLATAGYLARVVMLALEGTGPAKALETAADADYGKVPIKQWVRTGLNSKDMETTAAITRLGANCHLEHALPSVVHLIAKYPDDLSTCLVECVMAGGDSAARAMAAGMVLGAALGIEAIPPIWLERLNQRERIMQMLDKIA